MPIFNRGSSRSSESSPRRRKRSPLLRSRSRSSRGSRRQPTGAATVSSPQSPDKGPNYQVVDGVPKNRERTYRAEVNCPRPAQANSNNAFRSGFICIRGPSRMQERDAKDDGDKMLDAFHESGMDGCRRMQKTLMKGRLTAAAEDR
eukprot:TRINITY_DN18771_c0_g5_i1.p1 TRINITY_DN18771_c0_g5~~TRINITY_DN18771_c0_g5_i1.p1  ORF type:complete len:156 (+),score=15.72 TRINITY_DN18771_c0_g5_i1:31-468(+)